MQTLVSARSPFRRPASSRTPTRCCPLHGPAKAGARGHRAIARHVTRVDRFDGDGTAARSPDRPDNGHRTHGTQPRVFGRIRLGSFRQQMHAQTLRCSRLCSRLGNQCLGVRLARRQGPLAALVLSLVAGRSVKQHRWHPNSRKASRRAAASSSPEERPSSGAKRRRAATPTWSGSECSGYIVDTLPANRGVPATSAPS